MPVLVTSALQYGFQLLLTAQGDVRCASDDARQNLSSRGLAHGSNREGLGNHESVYERTGAKITLSKRWGEAGEDQEAGGNLLNDLYAKVAGKVGDVWAHVEMYNEGVGDSEVSMGQYRWGSTDGTWEGLGFWRLIL